MGSVWTGNPDSSPPPFVKAWTKPLPSLSTSSSLPSPFKSANAGDPPPSPFRYLGHPVASPGFGAAKYSRCSMASGVAALLSATTTRTRKAYRSGRSGEVGSSAGVYGGTDEAMAAETVARLMVARVPVFGDVPAPVATVVQRSRAGQVGGCTPGANSTRYV